MLPSSRTPEGDPLRCPICGASHKVEFSIPPGDVVCPSCGALAWFVERYDPVAAAKAEIRTYVADLSTLTRGGLPVDQLRDLLVSGMTRCLAAYGAMLWLPGKRRWWPSHATMNLVAFAGESDSADVAENVAKGKHDIVFNTRMAGRETLVIGVPVMRGGIVLAVIEVLQRAGSREATQKGYVRFLNQVADIIADSSTLTA